MISEFEKEKVFWTRKMNLKLVKFIENRPNIWNPKHPKYTSVESRDKTYNEFADKYGNKFTGQAVKDRWTNIRSTFANYLRKLYANFAKNGSEEYKINWHLWEPCQFLMKVNRKIRPGALNSEDLDDDDNKYINGEEDISSDEEKETHVNTDDFSDSACKTIADHLVSILKNVQNDAFGIDNSLNGQIGRNVAKRLAQMNSYDAARASQKIMEILARYDRNNPENPNRNTADCL